MHFECHLSCLVERQETAHLCEGMFTILATAATVDEVVQKCRAEILRLRKEGNVFAGVRRIEMDDLIEIAKFPDVAVTRYDVTIPSKGWTDHVSIHPFEAGDLKVWQSVRAVKEHPTSDTARMLPFLEFGPDGEPTPETM